MSFFWFLNKNHFIDVLHINIVFIKYVFIDVCKKNGIAHKQIDQIED